MDHSPSANAEANQLTRTPHISHGLRWMYLKASSSLELRALRNLEYDIALTQNVDQLSFFHYRQVNQVVVNHEMYGLHDRIIYVDINEFIQQISVDYPKVSVQYIPPMTKQPPFTSEVLSMVTKSGTLLTPLELLYSLHLPANR